MTKEVKAGLLENHKTRIKKENCMQGKFCLIAVLSSSFEDIIKKVDKGELVEVVYFGFPVGSQYAVA